MLKWYYVFVNVPNQAFVFYFISLDVVVILHQFQISPFFLSANSWWERSMLWTSAKPLQSHSLSQTVFWRMSAAQMKSLLMVHFFRFSKCKALRSFPKNQRHLLSKSKTSFNTLWVPKSDVWIWSQCLVFSSYSLDSVY